MWLCDIYHYSHMFTLNSHWNCIFIQFRMFSFYTSIMDTTYYSNIPVETDSPYSRSWWIKEAWRKNRLYKDHPKGFYVYAKFKSTDNDSKNSKDIQGWVNYFIRYAGRPAMAENRITEYNKESNTVSWFYNDHKDEKRHDVTDNVIDFINRLIIHIPDYHFLIIRCQCF